MYMSIYSFSCVGMVLTNVTAIHKISIKPTYVRILVIQLDVILLSSSQCKRGHVHIHTLFFFRLVNKGCVSLAAKLCLVVNLICFQVYAALTITS